MTARQTQKRAKALTAAVAKWRQQRAELEQLEQTERAALERRLRLRRSELEIAQSREYFELRQQFGAELGPGPLSILQGGKSCPR